MKRPVKTQKVKEIKCRPFRGEHSPYWDWTHERQLANDSDGTVEAIQANPNTLPETKIATPSTPQLLMGEAIQHLQGRQREVYLLVMREGKSLAEAAEVLGIEKGSAQKYKERAIKFLTQYCKAAIKKGRV